METKAISKSSLMNSAGCSGCDPRRTGFHVSGVRLGALRCAGGFRRGRVISVIGFGRGSVFWLVRNDLAKNDTNRIRKEESTHQWPRHVNNPHRQTAKPHIEKERKEIGGRNMLCSENDSNEHQLNQSVDCMEMKHCHTTTEEQLQLRFQKHENCSN